MVWANITSSQANWASFRNLQIHETLNHDTLIFLAVCWKCSENVCKLIIDPAPGQRILYLGKTELWAAVRSPGRSAAVIIISDEMVAGCWPRDYQHWDHLWSWARTFWLYFQCPCSFEEIRQSHLKCAWFYFLLVVASCSCSHGNLSLLSNATNLITINSFGETVLFY